MSAKLVMIFCCFLLMAGTARAEQKLLITDVLDKGQVEAELDLGYSYTKNSFTVHSPNFQEGNVVHRDTFTDFSLGLGLGHNLQVGFSVPYVFTDRFSFEYTNPSGQTYYTKSEGIGDFTINGSYRLLGNNKEPFVLVAGLDVKLDTASTDKEGTGTTDYSPYLAVSTQAARNKLRPYAFCRAVIRNHGAAKDFVLGIGSEYTPYKDFSLVPFANALIRTNSNSIKGYEVYSFGLQSYIRAEKNVYLVPKASYALGSSTSTTDNSQDLGGLEGYTLAVGLYYLF